MKESIIVLGMHRSGTSVLAGLVSILGSYAGSNLMDSTVDNPKGYFENNKVFDLNEKILKENGASWDDYYFSMEGILPEKINEYVQLAKEVIQDELKFAKKIVIKDPRMCILFPIWEKALIELKIKIRIAFIFRNPMEVALSLKKRDEMSVEKGLMLWSHYFFHSEYYSRSYKRLIVQYSDDFYALEAFIQKLADFTGHELSRSKLETVKSFYSPKLKHQNIALDNISSELPSYLNSLIGLLIKRDFVNIKLIDRLNNEFKYSREFFLWNEKTLEDKLLAEEENKKSLEKKLLDYRELTNKQDNELRQQKEQTDHVLSQLEQTKNEFTIEKRDFEIKLEQMIAPLREREVELTAEKLKSRQLSESLIKKEKLKSRQLSETLIKKETLESELEKLNVSLKKEEDRSRAETQKLVDNIHNLQKRLHEKELIVSILEKASFESNKILNDVVNTRKNRRRINNNLKEPFLSKVKRNMPSPFVSKKAKKLLREKRLIIESGLFSPLFYLSNNPDILISKMDPLTHFCKYGWKERRLSSPYFNCSEYLSLNKDVANAGGNPLVHYIQYGKTERRLTSRDQNTNNPTTTKTIARNSKPFVKPSLFGPNLLKPWVKSIPIIALIEKYGRGKILNKKIHEKILVSAEKSIISCPLKVSVIMPTWNRAKSIDRSIDSILAQSFMPSEIIIVDDGSTDNTIALLGSNYKQEISDGLIKVINGDHQGVSAARNLGLSVATGDLIAYLDSDNIWRKHYLLLMVAIFSQNDELNCAYSALESHDNNNKNKSVRATVYRRKQLLNSNFIDLNVFIHRKIVYDQHGGFDTQLKRLVDWELVVRYTQNYMPAYVPFIGVDYYLDDKRLKNITTTVSLDDNRLHVYHKHFQERVRYGLESLRIAYVLWDFPALSQTFVMEELKWLVEQGHDVIVYYSVIPDKSANLDFNVEAHLVKGADELAILLEEHDRNLCHTHFAYPTTTLLTYPACVKTNTYFTFMPHAVDIFHHDNKKRNKIGEIAQHDLCLKIFVHGEFHKKVIEDCGVPSEKIAFNIQAINVADFAKHKKENVLELEDDKPLKGIVINRFVEKKGIESLIRASALLKNERVEFDIYGYGPLEDDYQKLIDKLGLNNIFIKGPLTSQQEVARAYEKSDFLIAPCVVAENGDMDGFPTVILEAMAVGLPVITTDIAAIPDYLTDGVEALVAPAGDVDQIADRVRRLVAMPPQRKKALINRSQDFLDKKIGVERTMQMLLDTWQGYSVDIFLVTFNTKEYDDRKETLEIINRIFKYTTTPFTLTIIDNNSDDEFWNNICECVYGYPNVRLIRKKQNIFCGPASNLALEMSDSEFSIYICSKEGFIKGHAWERTLLTYMRSNPNDAIAGHLSQMPNYIYGNEYTNHPEFTKFRNPEYAKENPERVFKHVQGGVFIIRRQFIKEHGGFNSETPQGGMDIEMSYYMESLGYDLGEIPEVASLTVKTIPKLPVILNENTVITHPLTIKTVTDELDSLKKNNGQRCNICGWKGDLFITKKDNPIYSQCCPKCESMGFSRSIMRILSNNHHIFRGENCAVLSADNSLNKILKTMFKSVFVAENQEQFVSVLVGAKLPLDCIIIDPVLIRDQQMIPIWNQMLSALSSQGEIIFADELFKDDNYLSDASNSLNTDIKSVFSSYKGQYSLEYVDYTSYCVCYDWRRFGKISLL